MLSWVRRLSFDAFDAAADFVDATGGSGSPRRCTARSLPTRNYPTCRRSTNLSPVRLTLAAQVQSLVHLSVRRCGQTAGAQSSPWCRRIRSTKSPEAAGFAVPPTYVDEREPLTGAADALAHCVTLLADT
jgi:hypothetical protein